MSATLFELVLPLVLLLAFLACRVPVALSLGGAGAIGILMQQDFGDVTSTLGSIPNSAAGQYSLTVIPMFILMGVAVSHAGLLGGVFTVADRLTRKLPGGLALAALGAATIFGGISGSSAADSATVGRLSIGEMSKRGYDKAYAAAVVAAVGTVSILIPPSIVLVIYGILSQESIGRLLLAGIVPGLLTAAVYGLFIVSFAARGGREVGGKGRIIVRPQDAGADGLNGVAGAPATGRRAEVAGVLTAALLFSIIVGGLYSGLFTATEAGAVAAMCATVLSLGWSILDPAKNRIGNAYRVMKGALSEAAALTSMIFLLVIGAAVFAHWLVLAGVPRDVSEWILGLEISPTLVVLAFLLILLVMGMLVDGLSMLLIVTPIAYPVVVTELGFDGVWFGIMMVKFIEIGLLTPPVGINVFVVSGLFPGLRAERIFVRILPFLIAELVVCAILFGFPEITTFLPDLADPDL